MNCTLIKHILFKSGDKRQGTQVAILHTYICIAKINWEEINLILGLSFAEPFVATYVLMLTI